MGLFDRFHRKKKNIQDATKLSEEEKLILEAKNLAPHKIESISGVTDSLEQMKEALSQIDGMRKEYENVTALLTDIQKIDRIPEKEYEPIDAAARSIIKYEKEREKYKTRDSKLSDKQRKLLERQEDKLAQDLKNMKQSEEYNSVLKSDLHHLEGEKGSLLYEQEEIMEKQAFLRKCAIMVAILVISFFALIAVLAYTMDKDLSVPFILTVIFAAIAETYIFLEQNKNRKDMKLIERKLNRAIGLLNKVKIKYVNNMSLLEYCYEKYDVGSFAELDYIWKQYIIITENEKKLRLNTEKWNAAIEKLLEELRKYQLSDEEIWIHQTIALIEPKEMVEVRHHLNVRRQKLRDNLDYNTKNYNRCRNDILKYAEENPAFESEIKDIARKYGISL